MIFAFGNIKGGVGKTTLALNFAIYRAAQGKDILLVDGDEQGTATTFTHIREQSRDIGYTTVRLHGPMLRTSVMHMKEKYDDIIIDVGGRDTGSLRAAMVVCDRLIIPVQPRSFDLWALEQMCEIVEEARSLNTFQANTLLNGADPVGSDNHDSLKALRGFSSFSVLSSVIKRRKSFPNAASEGLSVFEYMPKDIKACNEFRVFAQELENYPL
jgi:chromosome partitioning protein